MSLHANLVSLKNIASGGMLAIISLLAASPATAQIENCGEYISRAISQIQMSAGCNFPGRRWNNDRMALTEWCNRASPAMRAAEDAERRKALVICTGRFGRVEIDGCEDYAARAMSQSDLQVSKACGYTGARWGRNYGEHFNWCNGHPKSAQYTKLHANEDQARRNLLADCKSPGR